MKDRDIDGGAELDNLKNGPTDKGAKTLVWWRVATFLATSAFGVNQGNEQTSIKHGAGDRT